MKRENFEEYLSLSYEADGTVKVGARERRNLEFKEQLDANALRKCLKTVAAFANTAGGVVVFGVTDRNRRICGVEVASIPDTSVIDDLFGQHLSPEIHYQTHEIDFAGHSLFAISVSQSRKPPVIASKDCHTKGLNSKQVLAQGVIYYRRAGQSRPASGGEFRAIIDRRDEAIQASILSYIDRGRERGFEHLSVADFGSVAKPGDSATLYVPEAVAEKLNIIDRAKLVEDDGAPAYEIKGEIRFGAHSDKDPRKPLLPAPAARSLRSEIEKIFWKDFPWSAVHLRKAAAHLGFWDKDEGDSKHTAIEELTNRRKYLEAGRIAVRDFALSSPDEFVEVVGSAASKAKWRRERAERSDDE